MRLALSTRHTTLIGIHRMCLLKLVPFNVERNIFYVDFACTSRGETFLGALLCFFGGETLYILNLIIER
jgi:hypothetical protein